MDFDSTLLHVVNVQSTPIGSVNQRISVSGTDSECRRRLKTAVQGIVAAVEFGGGQECSPVRTKGGGPVTRVPILVNPVRGVVQSRCGRVFQGFSRPATPVGTAVLRRITTSDMTTSSRLDPSELN